MKMLQDNHVFFEIQNNDSIEIKIYNFLYLVASHYHSSKISVVLYFAFYNFIYSYIIIKRIKISLL